MCCFLITSSNPSNPQENASSTPSTTIPLSKILQRSSSFNRNREEQWVVGILCHLQSLGFVQWNQIMQAGLSVNHVLCSSTAFFNWTSSTWHRKQSQIAPFAFVSKWSEAHYSWEEGFKVDSLLYGVEREDSPAAAWVSSSCSLMTSAPLWIEAGLFGDTTGCTS